MCGRKCKLPSHYFCFMYERYCEIWEIQTFAKGDRGSTQYPVISIISSKNIWSTGNVLPGMSITGTDPKYPENKLALRVADINKIRRSFFRRIKSRRIMRRKSDSSLRSWTSSTMTWVTSDKSGSDSRRRSKIPVVQNKSRVELDILLSSRIWYPTTFPIRSTRSDATRSATPMADIRRGCVQTGEKVKKLKLFKSVFLLLAAHGQV